MPTSDAEPDNPDKIRERSQTGEARDETTLEDWAAGATETADAGEFEVSLSVSNVGGISGSTLTFSPGTTILAGENASNKTSFLRAMNGVLGGSMATLRTNADRGEVTLDLGEHGTYSRVYERTNGHVTTSGTPYSDDAGVVDTFVTLLETNDARSAVQRGDGDDLRDVLLEPVDTDEIKREIRDLQSRRDDVRSEIRELESDIGRGAELVQKRETRRDELERIEEQIAEKRECIDQHEGDADVAQEVQELVDELEAKRRNARKLEEMKDVKMAGLDGLESQKQEVIADLRDLVGEATGDQDSARERIVPEDGSGEMRADNVDWEAFDPGEQLDSLVREQDRKRTRKREIDRTIDDLSDIVSLNEQITDDADSLPGIDDTEDDAGITAELDPTTTVQCWTCGTTVAEETIYERTEEVRSLLYEKRSELAELDSEIDELQDRIRDFENVQSEAERIRQRLSELEREKEHTREEIANIEEKISRVTNEISTLQQEVAQSDELRQSALFDAYEALSDLEHERGKVRAEIDDIDDQLDEIEAKTDRKTKLEKDTLPEIRSRLQELWTRIQQIEKHTVDEFNGHMEQLLDELAYDSLARVWIEHKLDDSDTDLQTGTFELKIAREVPKSDSSSGVTTIQERDIDTLSESERELIGLVAALTGYLIHGIGEEIPFLLVDSVETIDADRLSALISYFSTHAVFLVVALLPEDAAEFEGDTLQLTTRK
jgi:predicted  nucleic acid-binding Zn-ribbon protein